MLNKRRLSGLGFAWLVVLHIVNAGMLIAIGWALVSGVNDMLFHMRGPGLHHLWPAMARVGHIFALWANVAIVLAIMIWMESDRLLPHEEQAWREAERRPRS